MTAPQKKKIKTKPHTNNIGNEFLVNIDEFQLHLSLSENMSG